MGSIDVSVCLKEENVFPPGFRFHPTDEELVLYYLKRKICNQKHLLDVITDTDVYKWDPQDLPGISKLKTGDRQWFFFTPRDKRFPKRCNRGTGTGYWKATGKDRSITYGSRVAGIKKTLIFYRGKAPKGERTDWVMHEYIMDDEELKRCQNVQELYALYKVFKKSGPGPKNGEQYGAEFKEEDWVDNASEVQSLSELNPNASEVQNLSELNPNAREVRTLSELIKDGNATCENNSNGSVDNGSANNEKTIILGQQNALDDLEYIMNQIVDDPLPVPLGADYTTYALEQFLGEKENQNPVIEDYANVVCEQPVQHNVQASFNNSLSDTTQLQFYQATELASYPNPNVTEQKPDVNEDDFLKDFLEMNDFDPEPTTEYHSENADMKKLQFDGFDTFADFDLSDEMSALLDQVEPGELAQISEPYVNNFENGVTNQVSSTYIDYSDNTNYQQQHHLNGANGIGCEMWSGEQRFCDSCSANANVQSFLSSSSGMVYQNQAAVSHTAEAVENGSNTVGNGSNVEDEGWFSSALWSFVESIPSSPASASESCLVKLSNLSRVRANVSVAAGNNSTSANSRCSSRIVYLNFYLLGVLCAMMWVLIATSLRVMY